MESINMKKYIFITMMFGLLLAQGAKNGTSAAPELNITPSAQYLSGGGAVAGTAVAVPKTSPKGFHSAAPSNQAISAAKSWPEANISLAFASGKGP